MTPLGVKRESWGTSQARKRLKKNPSHDEKEGSRSVGAESFATPGRRVRFKFEGGRGEMAQAGLVQH